MGTVLVTVELPDGENDVGGVCKRFHLRRREVDTDFGVVRVDGTRPVYAVRLDERAASRLTSRDDVHGPFADPSPESFRPDF
jgi:hypothetical protein